MIVLLILVVTIVVATVGGLFGGLKAKIIRQGVK